MKPVALVVEGDGSQRRLTVTILRQAGYEVFELHGSETVRESAEREDLDLLVVGLDLHGKRRGLELARQTWLRNPGIRIIVTGMEHPGPEEQVVLQEADMIFLSLPFSFARLSREAALPTGVPALTAA